MLEQRVSRLLVGAGFVVSLVICPSAIAQPIVPAADGANTQVSIDGNQFNIQGGQLSGDGANLFHSFQEFGLSAEQTANFLSQPEIQNILGRVRGGNASFIDGLLQVSGGNTNLYLINPAGILLGPNARLNLPANFTAATATGVGFENGWFDMTVTDFEDLLGTPTALGFDAAALGNLVNAGDLEVADGQTLSLLGGTVINTGELSAPGGDIVVAAIAPPDGGSAIVRLTPETGILSLDIQATTFFNDSEIEPLSLPQLITGGAAVGNATGLTVNDAGVAVLSGSGIQLPDTAGTTIIAGDIRAAGEVGGDVQITGDRIGLVTATLETSGINEGGSVLVGGDYQGRGALPTAEHVYVSADSSINARSLIEGNGGRVILWADDTNRFYGTVDVRGGQASGDGGFVEISGANQLAFDGAVLLEATNGVNGTLLLDPDVINIVDATNVDADGNILNRAGDPIFEPDLSLLNLADLGDGELDDDLDGNGPGLFENEAPGEFFYISEQALEALIGSVTLEATTEIRVQTLADNRLSFQAGPGDTVTFRTTTPGTLGASSIDLFSLGQGSSTTTNGGNLVLDVLDFSGASGALGHSYITDGGDVTITSNRNIGSLALIDTSSTTRSGGDVTLNAVDRVAFIREINTTSTSNVPGNNNGGDITITTAPATSTGLGLINVANTSSSFGDAGNIQYSSGSSIRGGQQGISFETSAPNGRAGDITLIASGTPSGLSQIQGLTGIRAISGIGTGGNLTLIADDINFAPNGPDPFGNPIAPAIPLQITGQIIFEPISADQDIRIGRNGIFGGTGAALFDGILDIDSYALNTFSNQPNSDGTTNFARGGLLVRTNGNGDITFDNTLLGSDPVQNQDLFIDITIEAGAGSTIIGPDRATDYIVLGTGSGIISGFGTDIDADGTQDTYLRFTNVGTIQAGNADDSLVFLNDTATYDGNFDGGSGNNILDFSGNSSVSLALSPDGVDGYTDALLVDLTANPAVVRASGVGPAIIQGSVANITGVIGGSGDDIILGDDNANLLGGGGGNDIIDGRGGDDIVEAQRDGNFQLLVGVGTVDPDGAGPLAPIDIDNQLQIDADGDGTFEELDQIANVEIARLLGGDGDNTFTIGADSWAGPVVLIDGDNGNDTYNIGLDGLGEGSIIVGDTGTVGTDTFTVIGTAADDTFNLDVADSPNSGGFDPDPVSGLVLPDDAALLARLDEDFSALPTSDPEVAELERVSILDIRNEQVPGSPLLAAPAYRVSRVQLETEAIPVPVSEVAAFSGIEAVSFDGTGGDDIYSLVLGATNAENVLDITINDTGTSGGDLLEVVGNEFANNFQVVLAADPNAPSQLSVDSPNFGLGAEIINFSGLDTISLDGTADRIDVLGDTYTVNLGSPSSIVLNINDSGGPGEGIDTLLVNGTDGADNFRIDANSVDLLNTGEIVPYAGIDALGLNAAAGNDTIAVTEALQFDFGLAIDAGAEGGDITVEADITVDGDVSTDFNTIVSEGIVISTSDGRIDIQNGTLSTASATGSGDPVTLRASDAIVTAAIETNGQTMGGGITVFSETGSVSTGPLTTSSTAGMGGNVNVRAQADVSMGDIETSGVNNAAIPGTEGSGSVTVVASTGRIDVNDIDTATDVGNGGDVALRASGDIISGAIATSGSVDSGDIALVSSMGSINTNGQGLTTATSGNGRGADITLQAASNVATGALVTTGVTSAGNVSVTSNVASLASVNTQGDGATSQGGTVTLSVADRLQITDTFVDNNGVLASISSVGGASSGEITVAFSDAVTFTVGDSTDNGTTGSISASSVLESGVFTESFEQGNIRILIQPEALDPGSEPPSPSFPVLPVMQFDDFQTLITRPTGQTPVPYVCVPDSNLFTAGDIELSREVQLEALNCVDE